MIILKGNSASLTVQNATPTITLPTTPTIELRQNSASSIAFVTIANGPSSATVKFDTSTAAVGTYTLLLESFDSSAGSSLATLKTDTITIYVTEFARSPSVASTITIL